MKYSAVAVLAAATGAFAWPSNVTYTTEVVTAYTTYCPGPTVISHSESTWTITEATTLTITNCPCTITKPVTTSSVVVCNTCGGYNATTTSAGPKPTGSMTTTSAPTVPTAGAGKVAAFSGAGLAGLLGIAAFVL